MKTVFACEPVEPRRLLAAAYSIIDLSISAAHAGFSNATVAGIDPTGYRIVGDAMTVRGTQVAIVWTTGRFGRRHVAALPSLGQGQAHAASVNAAGQIVGYFDLTADRVTSRTHACLWHLHRNGRYIAVDLGTLPGATATASSIAHAINASGLVVGTVYGLPAKGSALPFDDAVAWKLNKRGGIDVVDLSASLGTGGPGVASSSYFANDVNDAGDIVGDHQTIDAAFAHATAYIWRLGARGRIKTADVLAAGTATSVSTAGVVAISPAIFPAFTLNSFLFEPSRRGHYGTVALDQGGPNAGSDVLKFNRSGTAVGEVNIGADAAAWDPDLSFHHLHDEIPIDSGWESLRTATGIDDAGEIIGSGSFGGESHPFLLVPNAD